MGVDELGRRVGEYHQHAILTDEETDLLAALRGAGWTLRELAVAFEVSVSCVAAIVRGSRRGRRAVRWVRVHVRNRKPRET